MFAKEACLAKFKEKQRQVCPGGWLGGGGAGEGNEIRDQRGLRMGEGGWLQDI